MIATNEQAAFHQKTYKNPNGHGEFYQIGKFSSQNRLLWSVQLWHERVSTGEPFLGKLTSDILGNVYLGFSMASQEIYLGSRDPADQKKYTHRGSRQPFVIKYNALGDLQFMIHTLGNDIGLHEVFDMDVDELGQTAFVTGWFYPEIRINGQVYGRPSPEHDWVFIARIHLIQQRVIWFLAGETQQDAPWIQDTPKGTHIQSVGQTLVVSGIMFQQLHFPTKQLNASVHPSSRKLWVCVLSLEGKIQTLEILHPDAPDGALELDQMKVTHQSEMILLGRTNHNLRQGSRQATTKPRKSKFLVKLDAQARWLWDTTFGTPSATEGTSSMVMEPQGQILVVAQKNAAFNIRQQQLHTPQRVLFLRFHQQDGALLKTIPFD
ncbi:MAG: hypothetical protein AAGJ35_02845, partial [Myxococcota bacterium]